MEFEPTLTNNMENTIILTEHEAKQFLLYQKYHDIFQKLNESNAFSLEFGKVTLNFAYGELQNIVKENMVYRR